METQLLAAAQSFLQIGGVVLMPSKAGRVLLLRPTTSYRLCVTRREFRPMEQVSFLDNGTKVAAVNTKTYIFQRDMSRGPESDLIRTVNVPAVVSDRSDSAFSSLLPAFPSTLISPSLWAWLQTVMTMFKDRPLLANVISAYMRGNNEGLFATRSVGELLWGYEDGLLKALKVLEPSLDDVFGLFYKVGSQGETQKRYSQ